MIPHCRCQGSRSEDSREGVEKPFGDAENEITSEWWAFRKDGPKSRRRNEGF